LGGTGKTYPVPAGEARAEIEVLRSRFIASAAPASTVEEAKEFTARIRHEFQDASHHVSAYVVGYGSTLVSHSHDDGEPSGTAGRPALAVIQGSGLGDVVVVVTRYFGGTKLGAGGLVRAYGDAVRAVLEILPRARRVLAHTVRITVGYPLFERTRLAIAAHGGQLVSTEYSLDVTVTAQFEVALYAPFEHALCELSSGTARSEVIETLTMSLPPQST
jgi:uncharacterized YigZ family protein